MDRIIDGMRDEGITAERMPEMIFSFGCYAGEVFVRHAGGVWVKPEEVIPPHLLANFPFMLVKMPDGRAWSPISKALARLENGPEDSLAYLFAVAKGPA
jgi:hypothetical protein